MKARILLFGVCGALGAAFAWAQAPAANPMQGLARFAGTVVAVDGKEFKLQGPGGTTATYRLAQSTSITTSHPGTISDLASGQFVGCTAVARGSALYATECHIFPESMRGAGEGHYPWGRSPDTTMTNGDVTRMTNGEVLTSTGSAAGVVLKVSYRGGTQQIGVSPVTHITVITAGTASLVKPGAKVTGGARTAPDGTEVVQFLGIGS
ncbi:MAG TPA: hypothetical protein VMD49_07030 [Steroidobacteraceae bacterium]|jgi:hypothetical protein|nr:hypothetical protein [Steroidobacteraceae bacterium]